MPQKTPQERARHAKAAGKAMTEKKNDVMDTRGKSNHANKKSHGILRRKGFSERNVSVRSPPGEGKSRRLTADVMPVADESENVRKQLVPAGASRRFRKDGTRKMRSNDRGPLPVATTDGRKKKPSQMTVKRKGGPFKRTRLHGG